MEAQMETAPYQVVAFYKYVFIENAVEFAAEHLEYCKNLGLRGRIYVAQEGINGQMCGTTEQVETYIREMSADPRFADIDFKIDPNPVQAFNKMHVRWKPEIVHSGLRNGEVEVWKETGIHLDAEGFKQLKDREDVVVLDVRSEYETRIGKFKNAMTLGIDNFREFPEKVKELEHLKDKKVITYCTGGIKCEKASAYLLKQGFKDVYQLHGGVVRYGKDGGGEDFEGKLYVFDGRVVVDVNEVNPTLISDCIHCQAPSARMINCSNEMCNAKIVMCEDCGWEWGGCCSKACMEAEQKRPYDGTGYYAKPPVE